MTYNPDIHHRRSIRLKGYDYSRAGAYFVTICTQNRACLFGEIVNGKMILNDAGWMVNIVWDEMQNNYPGVETDEFIIMPNHIHGIIVLVGAGPRACPDTGPRACPDTGPRACPDNGQPQITGQPQGVAPTLSLPDVVHRFKTMTTKRYTDGVKKNGWQPFPGKLWQRNYYERIIRDENELNNIRQYIRDNPMNWQNDKNFRT